MKSLKTNAIPYIKLLQPLKTNAIPYLKLLQLGLSSDDVLSFSNKTQIPDHLLYIMLLQENVCWDGCDDKLINLSSPR